MCIFEGDKIKLCSGETAWVSEILGNNEVFIVELIKNEGGASIEQIEYADIFAKVVEVDLPLTA